MGKIRDFAQTFAFALHELSPVDLADEVIKLRAQRVVDIQIKRAARKTKGPTARLVDGVLIFEDPTPRKPRKKKEPDLMSNDQVLDEMSASMSPEAFAKLQALLNKPKRGRKKKAAANVSEA